MWLVGSTPLPPDTEGMLTLGWYYAVPVGCVYGVTASHSQDQAQNRDPKRMSLSADLMAATITVVRFTHRPAFRFALTIRMLVRDVL